MTAHLLTFHAGNTTTRKLPDHESADTRDYLISRGGKVTWQFTDRGNVQVIVGAGADDITILICEP